MAEEPIPRDYSLMTNKGRRLRVTAYSLQEALEQLRLQLEVEGDNEKVVHARPPKPGLVITQELKELLAEAMVYANGAHAVWGPERPDVKTAYLEHVRLFLEERAKKAEEKKAAG